MKKINVTKSYLPPFKEYVDKISTIWDNHILTNYGPLNEQFVDDLNEYLGDKNIHYVTNGTIALQLALEALGITEGEIITTPFTFVATTSAILWQRCTPVFVDISPNTYNIDVEKIEEKITTKTKAILAVHCFGYPCDVEELERISKKHNLFLIYDAAHAFGVKINGKSILSYGDISTCSLHATKVFHTIEGGLCVVNNDKYQKKLSAIKNFGVDDGEYNYVGINAKSSEFNAAMGICTLNHIDEIISQRGKVYNLYKEKLTEKVKVINLPDNIQYNYVYFPILFENKYQLERCLSRLNKNGIYPRRYFYPCINDIPIYNNGYETPIAHDISLRILCLPCDTYLDEGEITRICEIINSVVDK